MERKVEISLDMDFLETYKHLSGYAGEQGNLKLRKKIWAGIKKVNFIFVYKKEKEREGGMEGWNHISHGPEAERSIFLMYLERRCQVKVN